MTLPILPGLRWTGKIRVDSRVYGGFYLVHFDAEDTSSTHERFVYDVTTLTASQLAAWTGWREP